MPFENYNLEKGNLDSIKRIYSGTIFYDYIILFLKNLGDFIIYRYTKIG